MKKGFRHYRRKLDVIPVICVEITDLMKKGLRQIRVGLYVVDLSMQEPMT